MTIVNASDIVELNECARKFWFNRNPPPGFIEGEPDAMDQLNREKGLEHEQAVLDQLKAQYHVIEATSLKNTQELMEQGIDVIYQPQLMDAAQGVFGKPDFILRHEDGSYQAADAKSAHSVKTEIGIQLAVYRKLLGNKLPGIVYLATGEVAEVGDKFDAKMLKFIAEARSVLEHTDWPLVHYAHSKCKMCPYHDICIEDFTDKEALTLLYGVQSGSLAKLQALGIETISQLAKADSAALVDIPYMKGDKARKAVLQAQAWLSGEFKKLSEINLPGGTWVHFDIEDNPLTPDGSKHVYLWGFLLPPYASDDFDYVWTDHSDDDQKGWQGFLMKVQSYRERWDDLRFIHFSPHEYTTIKMYAERYQMLDDATVLWLLDKINGPLYDIKTAVDEHLVLPLAGYDLKSICKHPDLVNFQWEDEGSGSQWSIVKFNEFLETEDATEREKLKNMILGYNRDDVQATYKLEGWLRTL